jgi:hypothetical protein
LDALHLTLNERVAEDCYGWAAEQDRVAQLDRLHRAASDAAVEEVLDDFEVRQLGHDLFLLGSAFLPFSSGR